MQSNEEVKQSNEVKKLLMTVVESLVDHPQEININAFEGQTTWVFELKVHPSDVGKIIGKQGKTAHAIRTVMNAATGKHKVNSILQIVEPGPEARDVPY